ncbi:MAG: homoserine dehydrogenase [Ruminococcus sp.]|jgi:homoserine dehydrogenase|nr:homoserine dehydrogenase [Ruminococcus sp.]
MRKLAILGFGTVGSGTVESFYHHKEKIAKRIGFTPDIKYILDIRDFPESPYKDKVIHDFSVIENDPEIAVAAEVMGGLNPALDFTKRLLSKGISVVTSNKELVARHGAELLALAKANNCSYLFEASTGGAIPIIRTLTDSLSSNYIYKIQGILNGTTNFILTKMREEGLPFNEALKLAQDLGYAEKDPTADISGADSARKISILASIAFGKHIKPEWVKTVGIDRVTSEDMAYAESLGAKIKLVAVASKESDSDKIFITVAPYIVCNNHQLAHVDDVFNAVMVDASGAGRLMFYGQGAGKLPTASAVLADITAALTETNSSDNVWEECEEDIIIKTDGEEGLPILE